LCFSLHCVSCRGTRTTTDVKSLMAVAGHCYTFAIACCRNVVKIRAPKTKTKTQRFNNKTRPRLRGSRPRPRPRLRGTRPRPRPRLRDLRPRPRPRLRGSRPRPRLRLRGYRSRPRLRLRGLRPRPRPRLRGSRPGLRLRGSRPRPRLGPSRPRPRLQHLSLETKTSLENYITGFCTSKIVNIDSFLLRYSKIKMYPLFETQCS